MQQAYNTADTDEYMSTVPKAVSRPVFYRIVASRHHLQPPRVLRISTPNCATFSCAMAEQVQISAETPGDALWDAAWESGAGEATIQERSEELEGQPAAITLFCAWFCPFAQRAWIALEEKQVNYRYVEINTYEVRAKCRCVRTSLVSSSSQGRSR